MWPMAIVAVFSGLIVVKGGGPFWQMVWPTLQGIRTRHSSHSSFRSNDLVVPEHSPNQ
jgi:hypothetical protein